MSHFILAIVASQFPASTSSASWAFYDRSMAKAGRFMLFFSFVFFSLLAGSSAVGPPPQNVAVSKAVSDGPALKVTWDPPATTSSIVGGYKVQYTISNHSGSIVWNRSASPVQKKTEQIIHRLLAGTTYAVRVLAVYEGDGLGYYSAPIRKTTHADIPNYVSAPTLELNGETLIVTWTRPSNYLTVPVLRYVVQYSPDKAAWKEISVPDALSTPINNLINGSTYEVRVRALSNGTVGGHSRIASLQVIYAQPQPFPNLRIVSKSTDSATITWDASSLVQATMNITYFYGERRENGKCQMDNSYTTMANQRNFTLRGLRDGTTYCVRVSTQSMTKFMANISVTTEDIDECASGLVYSSTNHCSHNCTNTIGSFHCHCSEGYQLDSDRTTCLDMDECASDSTNSCSHNCTNTIGSFYCQCPEGYQLDHDNTTCLDNNECASNSTNSCSHICINTIGSFYCQCPEGYQLDHDNTTCLDNNECASNSTNSCSHNCTNTIGSFYCQCPEGYRLDTTCLDIDECASNSINSCSHICTNTIGSFYCQCPEGYQLDSDNTTCLDSTNSCSHNCTNTVGSGQCPEGYQLDSDNTTCLAPATCEYLESLIIPNYNASADVAVNQSVSLVENLMQSYIKTSLSDLQNIVEGIASIVQGLIRFLSSGVKLSPEVEDHLTRGLIDILSKVLDPEVLASLGTNTNGSSPVVVNTIQTVEKLGAFIASSNNTEDGATYQAANLDMTLAKRKSSEEVAVDVGNLSATISAAEGTVLVAVSYGQLGSDIPVSDKNGDVESNVVSLQLVDKANGEAVQPKSSKSPYSVEMTFNDVVFSENVTCGFYVYNNTGVGDWSTEGLKTVNCSSYVCCKSSHLTIFTVLVNVANVQYTTCPEGYQLDINNTTCLAPATFEYLESLRIPNYSASAKVAVNQSASLVENLLQSYIDTNLSPHDLQNLVERIVSIVQDLIRFLSSGVTLSPKVENRLTRGLVGILSNVLDPEVLTSLGTNTNGGSPVVVSTIQTVENLGAFIASSNNTEDGATYQAANLDMKLGQRNSSEEVAVDIGDLSATIAAAEGTVLVAVSYGELGSDIPVGDKNGDVESNVVSLQLVDKANGEAVQPKSSKSPYSVEMTFNDVVFSENVTCGFYVYDKNGVGDWSTEGLKTVNCSSYVCCKSSHLTNFAVLVNVGNVQHSSEIETALIALSYIGCSLSIICLFITVIALIVFRCKGQKTPLNFVHINLSVVLLTALVIFVGGSYSLRHHIIPCAIVTGLLHYLFLAVFSWMLCEGVMLYLMLVKVFTSMPKKLWFFMILGYGIPVVPVVVTAGVKHATYGINSHGCWLNTELHHGTIWGFAAPVMAIMIINLVFLALAIAQLCRSQKNSAARQSSNTKLTISTLKATVILLPLLGLTWVFGFITFDVQSENLSGLEAIPLLFQIIFILLNSTQGIFIFVFYVLRNEKLAPYWKKFCIKCCPSVVAKLEAYKSSKGKTSTVQLGTFKDSAGSKEDLTKPSIKDSEELCKDNGSITDVTFKISNLDSQNLNQSVVDVSEEQPNYLVLNDLDASDYTPKNAEFSLGEPVITSSVGLSRTSPI